MPASLALLGAVAANQLTQAGLRPGHWVLIQGAACALGVTTAAFARHLGAGITATSRNHFPLVPSQEYLFIAGGIGITPLL